ncbi:hypothetical protein [Hymenobacter volaticus]|uniref:Uncharacterized protein n=1 Tax=Hymenobacter volaticus TaxID=2932254 RepID=A0ABY4G107_9BACT|nr:hypothetical protein [Hymenobacter volaticus]UOQ64545.1 hypothetical protein MUN86_13230 [Hymenobacter volaticus]
MLRSWFSQTTLFIFFCCLGYVAQAGSGFADLKPGPHGVGFRVVQQYDYARSYKDKTDLVTGKPYLGERARPVQTLVWYPARKVVTPCGTPTTCARKPPMRYSSEPRRM